MWESKEQSLPFHIDTLIMTHGHFNVHKGHSTKNMMILLKHNAPLLFYQVILLLPKQKQNASIFQS